MVDDWQHGHGYASSAITGGTNLADNQAIVIDTIAPTISSITSVLADGNYGVAQVVDIDVTYSEAVTTSTSSLVLDSGGAASYLSGSGTTSVKYRYTVGATESSADLTVASVNTGNAVDGGGVSSGSVSTAGRKVTTESKKTKKAKTKKREAPPTPAKDATEESRVQNMSKQSPASSTRTYSISELRGLRGAKRVFPTQTTKNQDEVPWTRKKLRQHVLSCLKDRSRMMLSELGQEIPRTARGGRPLRTVLSGLGDFVLKEGIPPIWWVSLKRSSKTAETEKTEKVKTKKKHVAVHVQEERSCTELLTPAQLILWNEVEQFVGQVLSTDK